jgi:AraC-like DNA-binding protein
MTAEPVDPAAYLTLDEVQPTLDLAAGYHFRADQAHQYRVPGAHFVYVAEGRISGRSPTRGRAEAVSGDLLCFPFADCNEYAVHAPTSYYEAHVQLAPPPRNRHGLWLDGIGPLPLCVRMGEAAPRMRAVFDRFCLELGQPGPMHRARVTAGLWEMLALIAEVAPAATAPVAKAAKSAAAAPHLDHWQRARQRLGEDFAHDLPVQDLASACGMSVDHFIRGFRARFAIAPGHYRMREKLRQAAHLLRGGDQPIKAIAHAVGFADAYSFTRAFRGHFGVLPSDVRAGRAQLPPGGTPDPGDAMPFNRHVIPPDAGGGFYEKYVPRR